jgi:hypothetical protein
MVNAGCANGEKPATFGWLQFEKKALKELQHWPSRHPQHGTWMYMANRMSCPTQLSPTGHCRRAGIKRETGEQGGSSVRPQLHSNY